MKLKTEKTNIGKYFIRKKAIILLIPVKNINICLFYIVGKKSVLLDLYKIDVSLTIINDKNTYNF